MAKPKARGARPRNKKKTPRDISPSADPATLKLLLQAVHSIPDYAIFLLDTEGRVLTWNSGAASILGYSAPEVTGQSFAIFHTGADRERKQPETEIKEAKKIGRFEEEGWRRRKDGSEFWAHVVVTKLTDPAGDLVGFAKIMRDLSDYKVELDDAIRVRDEFLSIASHELKTPITSLKMQIQMLQAKMKRGEQPPADRLEKFLSTSHRQVNRLTQLVEDLLDVARAQANKLAFQREPLDLRALVEEVIEHLRDQFESAKCVVSFRAKESVVGNFDRFRMEQVVVNLLSNAIKYAPGSDIRISLERKGKRAVLKVADGGHGISSATQARLFGRFERGENAENISGLGLGLFISRQIVEGHGGSISLSNEARKGATFVVELPLQPPLARTPDVQV